MTGLLTVFRGAPGDPVWSIVATRPLSLPYPRYGRHIRAVQLTKRSRQPIDDQDTHDTPRRGRSDLEPRQHDYSTHQQTA